MAHLHARYAPLLARPFITTADALIAYRGDRRAAARALDWLRRRGQIRQVRRGLYIPVPFETSRGGFTWDPYLVASGIRKEYAIAFHSAFVVHGVAQNPEESRVHIATTTRFAPFSFQGVSFVPYGIPAKVLQRASTSTVREGEPLSVTRPEWTIAMCCRLVSRGGGFEEIYHSASGFRSIDPQDLLEAARAQRIAGVLNRVGFVAASLQESWRLDASEVRAFRKGASPSPVAFDAEPHDRLYIPEWKVYIPRGARELVGRA
jgi:predicted transcriptional regulator of viral defense system